MIIDIFKPISYLKKDIDISNLNRITAKKWNYAANGKSALYHCLKSLNVRGPVLIPVYACDSILVSIKELALEVYYYDVDIENLNPNVKDVEFKITTLNISCIVAVSLYGNAAKLDVLEEICKRNNVLIIDDAAQSFGATLNGKYVGTFGDAGFFSFSPGKATSAHMGAFFWTQNQDYEINRTKHILFHYISYLDFYYNRLNIYRYKKWKVFRILAFLKCILSKYCNIINDDMCNFEKKILGGVLEANEFQVFRRDLISLFIKTHGSNKDFRTITNGSLESNNHKLVLIFNDRSVCSFYYTELFKNGIYCTKGYNLLSNSIDVINAKNLKERILELPIEDNRLKFELIINSIELIGKNKNN